MWLFVGQPSGADVLKNDARSLPWARQVASRVWTVPGSHRQFLWQPLLRETSGSDLVIEIPRYSVNHAKEG